MTKLSRKPIAEDRMGLYVDEFWKAVTLLEDKQEVRAFFRDIVTSTERKMLAKRLQIAKLLYQGAPYDYIKKELAVSNETIANVARWLDSFGEGYRIVIPRLLSTNNKSELPKLWKRNTSAKLLAASVLLGSRAVKNKIKKIRKRHSVDK